MSYWSSLNVVQLFLLFMDICIIKIDIIDSDNYKSPVQHQVITCINVDFLLIAPSAINFIQIWIKIPQLHTNNETENLICTMAAILVPMF